MAQCREIAKKKMKDLNTNDVDAARKIIAAPPARWACRCGS